MAVRRRRGGRRKLAIADHSGGMTPSAEILRIRLCITDMYKLPAVQWPARSDFSPGDLRAGGGSAVAGEAGRAITGYRGDDPVWETLRITGVSASKM